jgi:antitoxin component of RelBE/YafQ-DinJ toxin-antitoxin module
MSVDRPQGLIEGSGRRGEPRRLDQMISARLDPALVAALKQLAEKRGMSLSDVLREAALLLLRREEAQNVITFSVNVTNERTGGVAHESFRQDIQVPA